MSALAYRYPVDKLLTGASLGNLATFLKLTPQSDVASLWSAIDNQFYCGRWVTHLYVAGERGLPEDTTHAAAYQETSYACGPLRARKRTFLPMRGEHLQAVYMIVELDNPTDEQHIAAVMCDVHYPAFVWPGTYKVPDQAQRTKRVSHKELNGYIISSTVGKEREVRVFGSDAEPASTYVSDRGFSRTYSVAVPPRSSARACFAMGISHAGEELALDGVPQLTQRATSARRQRSILRRAAADRLSAHAGSPDQSRGGLVEDQYGSRPTPVSSGQRLHQRSVAGHRGRA